MRHSALERLLARYGQTVEFYPLGAETPARTVRAVLQPTAERDTAWGPMIPTPLGSLRRDRFLYVGPPEAALDALGDGYLACRGGRYEIQEARAVFIGDRCSHWWGILRAREPEEEST